MQMHKGLTSQRLKLAVGPFAAYRDVSRSYRDEREPNAMRQEPLFPISPRHITLDDIIYIISCNRELGSRDYANQTKCIYHAEGVDGPGKSRSTDLTIYGT